MTQWTKQYAFRHVASGASCGSAASDLGRARRLEKWGCPSRERQFARESARVPVGMSEKGLEHFYQALGRTNGTRPSRKCGPCCRFAQELAMERGRLV